MLTKITKQLRMFIAAFALLGSLTVGVTQTQVAVAAPVDVLSKCTAGGSEVCKGTDKNSLYTVIGAVVNLLIVITGIIAVIMIIIGGIRYTTSAGDAGQTKGARDTIIYAVAGLVIAIMAFAIVNFVLSRI